MLYPVVDFKEGGQDVYFYSCFGKFSSLGAFYIMYLEAFAAASNQQRVFSMTQEELERESVNTLLQEESIMV